MSSSFEQRESRQLILHYTARDSPRELLRLRHRLLRVAQTLRTMVKKKKPYIQATSRCFLRIVVFLLFTDSSRRASSMASYGRYNSDSFGNRRNDSQYYAPSAPTLPAEDPYSTSTSSAPSSYQHLSSYGQSSINGAPSSYHHGNTYGQSSAYASPSNYHHGSGYGRISDNTAPSSYHHGSGYGQSSSSPVPPSYQHGSGYGQESSYGYPSFPPGTHADVIRSFQAVDRDRSGFIDENELQQAISSGFQRFNLGTIRLLMFLFKNPSDPLRIGPKEFAALWSCLGEWRRIFERYDRDRSGKIDQLELRDALYGIGYTIPASVLQILISRYGDGSGRKAELGFDSFVECGVIIKGLTDKFKEKDTRYAGSATLSYETFMSMIIPFLVQYD
ncbi:hypothetical protein L6164_018946 [Bauhinia variegata]|uniref:Uncharacterized protein n=1 Tax=Bauhinia variegata TaxID=167791 RepID=A0ACB9NDL8_BAUVA|nr:hypothetical protein L6164_018946 [Bauhinia variegata]